MSDTNVYVRVFYNEDDENYNKRDQLTQEGLRMVTRLITSRGLKQLAEYQRILGLLEYEVEIFRDGEKMPNVARDYQSEVAGDRVKVGDLETLDVKASDGNDDPVLSFEEKEMDGDFSDVELYGLPFW